MGYTLTPLQEEEVLRHYAKGLSKGDVGKIYGVSSQTIRRILIRHGVDRRSQGGMDRNCREYLNSHGRWVTRFPLFKRDTGKHTYRYVDVMERHLGHRIPKGYVVHHKDCDCTNDELYNLEVMTLEEHARWHGKNTPHGFIKDRRIKDDKQTL